jgi:hypothetical protein
MRFFAGNSEGVPAQEIRHCHIGLVPYYVDQAYRYLEIVKDLRTEFEEGVSCNSGFLRTVGARWSHGVEVPIIRFEGSHFQVTIWSSLTYWIVAVELSGDAKDSMGLLPELFLDAPPVDRFLKEYSLPREVFQSVSAAGIQRFSCVLASESSAKRRLLELSRAVRSID